VTLLSCETIETFASKKRNIHDISHSSNEEAKKQAASPVRPPIVKSKRTIHDISHSSNDEAKRPLMICDKSVLKSTLKRSRSLTSLNSVEIDPKQGKLFHQSNLKRNISCISLSSNEAKRADIDTSYETNISFGLLPGTEESVDDAVAGRSGVATPIDATQDVLLEYVGAGEAEAKEDEGLEPRPDELASDVAARDTGDEDEGHGEVRIRRARSLDSAARPTQRNRLGLPVLHSKLKVGDQQPENSLHQVKNIESLSRSFSLTSLSTLCSCRPTRARPCLCNK